MVYAQAQFRALGDIGIDVEACSETLQVEGLRLFDEEAYGKSRKLIQQNS